jgi:hypothetical protein
MLAKHALSQLSYGPFFLGQSGLGSRQSEDIPIDCPLPLAYCPHNWWAWEDLNFRPHAYQARALTN